DMALGIADYFLQYQSPITGLIPDEPGTSRSYLDGNTDFAVSLAKLAELTGMEKYRMAGETIVSGILAHHAGPFGFFRDVDLDTGQPVTSLVETRFCSLLLKALILYRDAPRIYGESGQWSLYRDR
ncbi:hypothetical protein JXA80_00565, partial [bacterium]|nr:hypothetical protein [candidate division CSSED10-310 bacterium]